MDFWSLKVFAFELAEVFALGKKDLEGLLERFSLLAVKKDFLKFLKLEF